MAMTRQLRRARSVSVPRDYPEMPMFPVDMTRTNVDAYRQQMADWWSKIKANLRGLEDEVESLSEARNRD